jgi:Transposase IS66 family
VRDERPFAGAAPPAVFYRYSPDPRGEHAEALLGSCRRFLHADGYAGFNTLFAADPKTGTSRLAEVACWAHARRKLYDVHENTASPVAKEALERIAELFAIEARINGRPPARRRSAAGGPQEFPGHGAEPDQWHEHARAGDPLRDLAMGGADAVHHRWPSGDDQQRRRAGDAPVGEA